MPTDKAVNLEKILNHPQVKKVTDDVNAEMLERRKYASPKCDAFSSRYTVLQETDHYRFECT